MHVTSRRLQPLGSPAFVVALALLVLNDFALKPLLHDWATGKLSDFAGLFALAIFCATFWPRRRLVIGVALSAAFLFWKSELSQPLIDWLNGMAPVPIARTVDYTDLAAVPAAWIGLWAARAIRPWPLPRAAQLALALLAPLAFAATSMARPYAVHGTVVIAPPNATTAPDEAAVQTAFDEIAAKHQMKCQVCDPLGDGRVYFGDNVQNLVANFDDNSKTLFFRISAGSHSRAAERDVDRLSMDIRAGLSERFPDLKLTEYVTNSEHRDERRSATLFTIHLDPETLDVTAVESTKRTLSQIIEDAVREHGLKMDKNYLTYYAGSRFGPAPLDRGLTLTETGYYNGSFSIGVSSRSDATETLRRALAETLEQRLRAAFGERLTVAEQ